MDLKQYFGISDETEPQNDETQNKQQQPQNDEELAKFQQYEMAKLQKQKELLTKKIIGDDPEFEKFLKKKVAEIPVGKVTEIAEAEMIGDLTPYKNVLESIRKEYEEQKQAQDKEKEPPKVQGKSNPEIKTHNSISDVKFWDNFRYAEDVEKAKFLESLIDEEL